MILQTMIVLAATTVASPVPPADSAQPTLAMQATLTLSVPEAQECADALVAKARKLGGYLTQLTNQAVTVKVPAAKMDELVRFAEGLGQVLQRSRQAADLSLRLCEQRTRLGSKQGMLVQYIKVLSGARFAAVVMVERQITQLIREIETLKGTIRVLEHQLQMASLRVSFRIQTPQVPSADGSSPFKWLNTVNLVDLYRDFTHEPE
jgi:hypothetical protein